MGEETEPIPGQRVGEPVTVRLFEGRLEKLEAFTVIDGGKVAGQLRRAVDLYIESRVSDPDFREQVETTKVRLGGLLDSLLEDLA